LLDICWMVADQLLRKVYSCKDVRKRVALPFLGEKTEIGGGSILHQIY
jgi:hypothetical protein